MDKNVKKYRRSAISIVCYVFAALMVLYIFYLIGSTVATINQYYAQYDMKAQPMEYVTYIMQTILEPLINTVVLFMFGYILDEVRKNNSAYYVSDEELEEAKIAKQEAKAVKKAAKVEAAALKAGDMTVTEQSVEADFAKSLDEELKAAEKKSSQKKSSSQNRQEGSRANQNRQNNQNSQNNQNRKKADGAVANRGNNGGSNNNNNNNNNSNNNGNNGGGNNGNRSGNPRRRNYRKPAGAKVNTEAKAKAKAEAKEVFKAEVKEEAGESAKAE